MTEEEDWNSAYKHLKAYKARKGHCRVPLRHKEEDGYKLGAWAGRQRTSLAKGDLAPRRSALLDELGFMWDEL